MISGKKFQGRTKVNITEPGSKQIHSTAILLPLNPQIATV